MDPGIPNNFPYKDQVLAEIADQRRQLEEDRAALKAANKGKRIQKAEDDSDDEDAEPVGQPGVSLVAGKRILEAPAKPKAVRDDSPPPLLFDSDLPTLQAALEKADVWLEVVDARDPLGSRSPWLEQLFETPDEGDKVAKGKIVVVLTKIGASHSCSLAHSRLRLSDLKLCCPLQTLSPERLSTSGFSTSDLASPPSSSSPLSPPPTSPLLPLPLPAPSPPPRPASPRQRSSARTLSCPTSPSGRPQSPRRRPTRSSLSPWPVCPRSARRPCSTLSSRPRTGFPSPPTPKSRRRRDRQRRRRPA